MMNNQFGIVGLLTTIRVAKTDPNLVTLAMGEDLNKLNLNLNSEENLHSSFVGPFANQPCRLQEIEHAIPREYLVNFAIRKKLPKIIPFEKCKNDLLFFLFHTNVDDILQLVAAAELYRREWRYHIEEMVWIARIPLMHYLQEEDVKKERGFYYYFNPENWKTEFKEFQIGEENIDKRPNFNGLVNLYGQPVK